MSEAKRSVLYIDTAYPTEKVLQNKHHQFFEARHSGGYFETVWGLHPLADRVRSVKPTSIEFIRFSDRQTVIEGSSALYRLPRWLMPLNLLLSQIKLLRTVVKVVKRHRVSMIVATDPLYGGLFGLLVKRFCRIPLAIYVLANYDEIYEATGALAMPKLLRWRWLEAAVARLVLRSADLVIGGNRNNLDYAVKNGARKRTAVIPVAKNAARVHYTPPAERGSADEVLDRLAIPKGRPLMLYLGRLLELKHPDDAVRAMAEVIRNRPDAVGLVAGTGPMREELGRLAAELGAADGILFLGHVNQEDLSRITPLCINISPLTGQALIESALGGAPPVAYDRDWQSDFVSDGVNGYVVPFRDHQALARKALDIIEHPETHRRFSAAIRERALEYADVEKIYALERSVYDPLLTR